METLCAECKRPMSCNPEHDCWCSEMPRLLPVPDAKTKGCLCRGCLTKKLEAASLAARLAQAGGQVEA